MELQKDYRDIWYSVIALPQEDRVDFKIFKIKKVENQTIFWECADPNESVNNINDAAVYLHGFVKWDGCSNWWFDAQNKGMLHFCERKQFKDLGDLLTRCWDFADKLMGNNFDG